LSLFAPFDETEWIQCPSVTDNCVGSAWSNCVDRLVAPLGRRARRKTLCRQVVVSSAAVLSPAPARLAPWPLRVGESRSPGLHAERRLRRCSPIHTCSAQTTVSRNTDTDPSPPLLPFPSLPAASMDPGCPGPIQPYAKLSTSLSILDVFL